ncbi:hypothetical protein C5167_002644 [Papaver somniferum]|uniref:DUF620 domain-containing protein n=1 Tax=Papaver somniferum TaxID=3469 RepID=A0A4Y7KYQ1_PAPSO|nr:uncharacterized protein LOC113307885 [Papaver somniferum]RZC78434.1 hypothetical protein C5167_002644 [Papaver somniferum]
MMKKLCPNYDREDGLETVLEVPIPEDMLTTTNANKNNHHNNINNITSWQNMKSWMRSHIDHKSSDQNVTSLFGGRNAELQILLGVVGAPLIPLPLRCDQSINPNIRDSPNIETSMAKYIVQQYIAATGGDDALNAIDSMYAMGKVRMVASEFSSGDKGNKNGNKNGNKGSGRNHHGSGEVGGFVLWQKRPELWCLELVLSGCKISAGSDGKVAWRQTPWHHSHASRGPPRPLRRSLQGLDPKLTANMFSNSICIGEKAINEEDCFVLKLEAKPNTLKARSSSNVEIIRHTVWGYFSQRTGLLVSLEDSHLLRIKATGTESVYWETTMESLIQDYRHVDGINIAHAGRTTVSLFRFGENNESHSKTKMEETWTIEEIDFNIVGLSMDCFLPPADLRKEIQDGRDLVSKNVRGVPLKTRSTPNLAKVGLSKVVAVNVDDSSDSSNSTSIDDDEEFL